MGHRYIGSKNRILNEVVSKIKESVPRGGRVVDLMTGTGTVALALRAAGFKVVAADLMTYSFHHARVMLLLDKPPKFTRARQFITKHLKDSSGNSYQRVLDALNSVPPKHGYFWREFSPEGKPRNGAAPRKYFSAINAEKIDAMRFWIKKLHKEGRISDLEHSLLLHDLIMAANDVANISGTYGHYLSRITGRANDLILLKQTKFDLKGNTEGHSVLRGYAEKLAGSISCELCYIDPPYMKRQYAANYHVLETLAREDNPLAIGISGLRPWRDQYSDFCTKTKIRDAFRKIFSSMDCPRYLVSYSQDGLVPIKELEKLFSEFGKVKITTLKINRFRSNQSKLEKELTEYLIYLERKPKAS